MLRAEKGQAVPILQRHWCRWDGRPEGRADRMPHIKTYLRHKCARSSVLFCAAMSVLCCKTALQMFMLQTKGKFT